MQWEKLQQSLLNSIQIEKKIGYSECNLIVFDWISTKLHIFVSGLRELSPRHLKKKERYVYLISENVGSLQTDARDSILVLRI